VKGIRDEKTIHHSRRQVAYLDDGEIMPDGGTLRVSSFLMDSADAVQQSIAASTTIIASPMQQVDQRARVRVFCYAANSNNETQARIAYDQMVARNQSNWRGRTHRTNQDFRC